MKLKLIVLLLCAHFGLVAQIDYDIYPEVSSTFLINDVHIQKSPTDSFGLGDILIEEGYITQVSRNINPPAEAFVIEGDSAYVYPAFISALSHTGIPKKEERGERPTVKFRGHPPNGVVGITPEVKASDEVSASDESISKMKAQGFAAAHIVPRGKMLPGQGSVMLLDGESNEEMLFADDLSMYFQLEGTRGFYPTTVIGVMAKWRDLYGQANFLSKHQAAARSSTTAARAKSDQSLEALIPVTKGQQTVYMKAEKAKDIHKAIALQKEMGYKLVLVEVKQAAPALEKIKAGNIPVLISADLPKEAKDEGKAGGKGKKGMKKDEGVKDKMKAKADDAKPMKKADKDKKKKEDSPEVKAMKARKKASYEEYVGQAATLEKEGVSFAFSFLDSKPGDLKKSLERMMKAGLSKEAALAALTTNPAKILGIDSKVGTIARGKLANLFLSDAPYFDKESNIKYLFVEGNMSEFEIKPKKKKGEKGSDDFRKSLVGKWQYDVETPMGAFDGIVTVTGDEELEIEVVGNDEPTEVMEARNIDVGDQTLSFVISINVNGTSVPATMSLDYDEDTFSGTVEMEGMGSMPISGSKVPE